jgi:hypothetical protein
MNRALRDLALPIPAGVVMHDWWLALVAAAFGRIGRVDQPTALYRQHGANDTGARQGSLFSLLRVFSEIGRIRNDLQRIRSQAELFLERYRPMLQHDAAELVEAFARLGERGAIMRRVVIVRYGFYHTGFLRNVGMLLVC